MLDKSQNEVYNRYDEVLCGFCGLNKSVPRQEGNIMKKVVLRLIDWSIWLIGFVLSAYIVKYTVSYEDMLFIGSVFFLFHIASYEIGRMYNIIWRYLDVYNITRGVICEVLATFVTIAALLLMNRHATRILSIAMCIDIVIWTSSRIIYAMIKHDNARSLVIFSGKGKDNGQKKVMIIGGGNAAMIMLDEIRRNYSDQYYPACILDDDTNKIGRSMYRTKIVGNTSEIREWAEEYKIDLIIFAMYNIEEEKKKNILNECVELNIPVKMLPHYASFMDNLGKNMMYIRDVSVSDLLGRKKAHIDNPKLNEFVEGNVVLVTGGGGSIGSELCKQIIKHNPKHMIIADVYENGAYNVQQSILGKGYTNFSVEIASITDYKQMKDLFEKYKPDIVYHAAAHKHVPLMENCRIEAVKNNIYGTKNIVELADEYGVEKFVMVSTDKAVNPTNVMGATKRACELIVKSQNDVSKTHFVSVRFGNVLGSNGSVIPLFKEQIKRGGPVTVTSPDCIRYFMTIPEAVELLLTAGSMAEGGETFVLDMGEPVKIDEMARKMIRLSGFIPDVDIKVEYIGMRPGEKMYEELLVDLDTVKKTCSEKIFVDSPETINREELLKNLEEMKLCAEEGRTEDMMLVLKRTVPTYKETN